MSGTPADRATSLGAVLLLGSTPAPGHRVPHEPLPDTWLAAFKQHHADNALYRALFRSCPAGRDWVLTNAPSASLTLDTNQDRPPFSWLRQLAAVQQALATRNAAGLLTQVTVYLGETKPSAAACVAALQGLRGATQGVRTLTLRAPKYGGYSITSQLLTDFLKHTGAAFIALRTVRIVNGCCALPPPSQLPHLRSLSMSVHPHHVPDNTLHTVCVSIGRYLPQLTTLEFTCRVPDFLWPMMLTQAHTSHTLTHLTTQGPLDNALLCGIRHLPALRQLTVGGLNVRPVVGENSGHVGKRVWGLERLIVGWDGEGSGHRSVAVQAEQLAALPWYAAGKVMQVRGAKKPWPRVVFSVTSTQGLDPSISERMSQWRFSHCEVTLTPHTSLPRTEEDHTLALTSTLAQLPSLQTDKDTATVVFTEWDWPYEAVQHAAACMSELTHLTFGFAGPYKMTNGCLSVVLLLGVRYVCVKSLLLSSDTHANTPWPWERLTVEDVNAADVPFLPDPGQDTPPTIRCDSVFIDLDVEETGVDRVMDRLSRVKLAPMKPHGTDKELTVFVYGDHARTETLRSQVRVLSAVNWDTTQGPLKTHLCEWPFTHDTMPALQGLPGTITHLHFADNCTWPLEPAEYTALAEHVPVHLDTWVFESEEYTKPFLEAVVAGINEKGARLGKMPCVYIYLSRWTEDEGFDIDTGKYVELFYGDLVWL